MKGMHELLGIREFISEGLRDCPRNLLPRSKAKIRNINNIKIDCCCVCRSDLIAGGRESSELIGRGVPFDWINIGVP